MTEAFAQENITLGKTDVQIPAMGIGTWAWGGRSYWGFGQDYGEEDVRGAFDACMANGINFFDTAEIYGSGKSELLLGKFIKSTDQPVVIATKFMPFPWRLWKGRLTAALRGSLDRLSMERVELYQVHQPYPPLPAETWAEGLAKAVEKGLTRAVGVSNYDINKMRRAESVLAAHGIPLASNQVEYSLLNRAIEFNGLLSACKEDQITLIAYSPLEQGLLTGKYTPDKPPPGIRGLRYRSRLLGKIQPMIRLMRGIGQAHGGRSAAQVALNWAICKGTVPIPGAKTAHQAQENIGALGWRLSEEEMERLDSASQEMGTE
ncbi:MAG TPA: aldo/keto reductase [Anaerolineales bacterium]|jgi:aryl-alcohol dehydrogenase-like predicted oxidoreductase|nr:aldo/keto reductase [Anaerolineales bacterium]